MSEVALTAEDVAGNPLGSAGDRAGEDAGCIITTDVTDFTDDEVAGDVQGFPHHVSVAQARIHGVSVSSVKSVVPVFLSRITKQGRGDGVHLQT